MLLAGKGLALPGAAPADVVVVGLGLLDGKLVNLDEMAAESPSANWAAVCVLLAWGARMGGGTMLLLLLDDDPP